MSALTYNSVDLGRFIRTKEVDIDLVMDPSGVDPVVQHVVIHVQCLLDRASLGQAPRDWIKANYAKLTQPRQSLQFSVGSSSLITADTTTDVKNGPIPKGLKIIEINSDESMMMLFTIETWLHTCANGQKPQNILSHRWRENVSIDQDFYTTWTRTGTVVFRSQVTQPDDMRGTFYPPVVQGFQRIRSDWTIDEAGTGYSYVIEDREQYLVPPAPATFMSGSYAVSSPNNAQCFGECNVTLRGAKTTSKAQLIQLVAKICLGKFFATQRFNAVPVGGAISEDLMHNQVSMMMRARWSPSNNKIDEDIAISPIDWNLGTLPYGTSPSGRAPDFGPYGTSGQQVIKAVIQDWCQQGTSLRTVAPQDDGKGGSAGSEASSVTINTGQVFNLASAGYYADTKTIYVTYTITKAYRTGNNVLQLPIASSTSADACSIVQIAAPLRELEVSYQVEGIGAMPVMPSTAPTNSAVIVKWENLTPLEPSIEPDGATIRYSATGQVCYGFKTTDAVAINSGVPPWIKGVQSGSITYTTTQPGIIGREA